MFNNDDCMDVMFGVPNYSGKSDQGKVLVFMCDIVIFYIKRIQE